MEYSDPLIKFQKQRYYLRGSHAKVSCMRVLGGLGCDQQTDDQCPA